MCDVGHGGTRKTHLRRKRREQPWLTTSCSHSCCSGAPHLALALHKVQHDAGARLVGAAIAKPLARAQALGDRRWVADAAVPAQEEGTQLFIGPPAVHMLHCCPPHPRVWNGSIQSPAHAHLQACSGGGSLAWLSSSSNPSLNRSCVWGCATCSALGEAKCAANAYAGTSAHCHCCCCCCYLMLYVLINATAASLLPPCCCCSLLLQPRSHLVKVAGQLVASASFAPLHAHIVARRSVEAKHLPGHAPEAKQAWFCAQTHHPPCGLQKQQDRWWPDARL